MLEGNIHMIGNFDQCKNIKHVLSRGSRAGDVIAGSYCHVQFDIPLEHLPPIPGDVRNSLLSFFRLDVNFVKKITVNDVGTVRPFRCLQIFRLVLLYVL